MRTAAQLGLATPAPLRLRQSAWWRDAVGYQVYLPSFADSDGDGWGDLAGVASRLDYLVDLGVDIIWLTPFYPSPMRDHGYDVADYRSVAARFGGADALSDLLTRAHARGLRVVGDLVVNHTSDTHPWFQTARSDLSNPYRGYYIWRDPAPDGGPPNNWLSQFGGSAWTLDESSGQYYLHLFDPFQPDLNWRHPAVADEIDAVLHHWLALGLDGFRIDTAAYLLKHPDLPDNPPLPDGQYHPAGGATDAWRRQDHRYDIHQPDVHTLHERWRRIADQHHAFLVGEVYEPNPHALARYVTAERLHSSFWFGLVEGGWDPNYLTAALTAAAASPRLSWVQGNHDRSRAATRFGGGSLGRRRSIALHTATALLPGTLWLYQGEELGLLDGQVTPDRGQDPLAAGQTGPGRDVARTPMPWAPGRHLQFSTGQPWLPDQGRGPEETVARQRGEPGSHLNAVRRLIRTRRHLLGGDPQTTHDDVSCELLRTTDRHGSANDRAPLLLRRGVLQALVNLSEQPSTRLRLPSPAIFDTDDRSVAPTNPRGGEVSLSSYQALLLGRPAAPSRRSSAQPQTRPRPTERNLT